MNNQISKGDISAESSKRISRQTLHLNSSLNNSPHPIYQLNTFSQPMPTIMDFNINSSQQKISNTFTANNNNLLSPKATSKKNNMSSAKYNSSSKKIALEKPKSKKSYSEMKANIYTTFSQTIDDLYLYCCYNKKDWDTQFAEIIQDTMIFEKEVRNFTIKPTAELGKYLTQLYKFWILYHSYCLKKNLISLNIFLREVRQSRKQIYDNELRFDEGIVNLIKQYYTPSQIAKELKYLNKFDGDNVEINENELNFEAFSRFFDHPIYELDSIETIGICSKIEENYNIYDVYKKSYLEETYYEIDELYASYILGNDNWVEEIIKITHDSSIMDWDEKTLTLSPVNEKGKLYLQNYKAWILIHIAMEIKYPKMTNFETLLRVIANSLEQINSPKILYFNELIKFIKKYYSNNDIIREFRNLNSKYNTIFPENIELITSEIWSNFFDHIEFKRNSHSTIELINKKNKSEEVQENIQLLNDNENLFNKINEWYNLYENQNYSWLEEIIKLTHDKSLMVFKDEEYSINSVSDLGKLLLKKYKFVILSIYANRIKYNSSLKLQLTMIRNYKKNQLDNEFAFHTALIKLLPMFFDSNTILDEFKYLHKTHKINFSFDLNNSNPQIEISDYIEMFCHEEYDSSNPNTKKIIQDEYRKYDQMMNPTNLNILNITPPISKKNHDSLFKTTDAVLGSQEKYISIIETHQVSNKSSEISERNDIFEPSNHKITDFIDIGNESKKKKLILNSNDDPINLTFGFKESNNKNITTDLTESANEDKQFSIDLSKIEGKDITEDSYLNKLPFSNKKSLGAISNRSYRLSNNESKGKITPILIREDIYSEEAIEKDKFATFKKLLAPKKYDNIIVVSEEKEEPDDEINQPNPEDKTKWRDINIKKLFDLNKLVNIPKSSLIYLSSLPLQRLIELDKSIQDLRNLNILKDFEMDSNNPYSFVVDNNLALTIISNKLENNEDATTKTKKKEREKTKNKKKIDKSYENTTQTYITSLMEKYDHDMSGINSDSLDNIVESIEKIENIENNDISKRLSSENKLDNSFSRKSRNNSKYSKSKTKSNSKSNTKSKPKSKKSLSTTMDADREEEMNKIIRTSLEKRIEKEENTEESELDKSKKIKDKQKTKQRDKSTKNTKKNK